MSLRLRQISKRLTLSALLCLSLAACMGTVPAGIRLEEPGWIRVTGVPFFPQHQRDDCGAVALASLIAHRGKVVSSEEIAATLVDSRLGGALLPEMENYARGKGMRTRSGRGTPELLEQVLTQGYPLILPLEFGVGVLARPHYVVLTGWKGAYFLLHDGRSADVLMERDELLRRWEEQSRLYLYIDAGSEAKKEAM